MANQNITCPIESMRCCLAFSPRDFSTNGRDAWIYGILLGWDDEALAELKAKFHWDDEQVDRLKTLHEKCKALAEEA